MHAPGHAVATDALLAPAATLDALEHGAVVRWWQTTAFLELRGPDVPNFLDGLCTQAVERIAVDTAVPGLFLDAKAKIIAPAVLHRAPDAPWTGPKGQDPPVPAPRMLLETLPALVEPLRAHLARFRLRARVTIDAAPDLATVAVAGAGLAAFEPPADSGIWTTTAAGRVPTRTFIGSPTDCTALVREQLPALGIGLADPDAFEAARIAAGVPGLHDLLPGRMPAEVGGMEAAVALDAGCYLGQEPVARLHYRGRANRTLRRLVAGASIEPGTDPDTGCELRPVDGDPEARPSGRLTTWSTHPDGRVVALAMLRREVPAGSELVLSNGRGTLRVVDDAPS